MGRTILDSREWWRRAYRRSMIVPADLTPSNFARDVNAALPHSSRVLELGCGTGQDSLMFARAGHDVVATDFVRQAEPWQRTSDSGIAFVVLDMRSPLPFKNASFEVVYARLSLHYFSNEVSHRIFAEIHRLLTSRGLLACLCKSTNDPRARQGEIVGPGLTLVNDKVYHFFDEAFAHQCLDAQFHIERLWSGPADTYGEPSDVVGVWATKR